MAQTKPTKRKAAAKKKAAAVKKRKAPTKESAPTNGVKAAKNGRKKRASSPGAANHAITLRGMMLLKYRAISAELSAITERKKSIERDLEILGRDPTFTKVFMALAQRKEAQQELVQKVAELQDMQRTVAKKHNIPIEKLYRYVIDTESGAVMFDPPANEGG